MNLFDVLKKASSRLSSVSNAQSGQHHLIGSCSIQGVVTSAVYVDATDWRGLFEFNPYNQILTEKTNKQTIAFS